VLLLRSCTRERTHEILIGLTGLIELVRLTKIADWISEQIELAGLLTRKGELWRTRLAREAGLRKA
jgi:hypothetical protein